MCPTSVYFGMFIQLITTISLLLYGFDQAARGLDEGTDVDLFYSLGGSTLRKILFFCPYTSHEHSKNFLL